MDGNVMASGLYTVVSCGRNAEGRHDGPWAVRKDDQFVCLTNDRDTGWMLATLLQERDALALNESRGGF